MMYYAVLDTNVLVSALIYRESMPGMVVSHALVADIIPLLSKHILEEYNDVLRRPKFKFREESVEVLIEGILLRGIHVEEVSLEECVPDPKDAVFYEVVMEALKKGDSYLVTGNLKHFPKKPFVVTPREMLELMAKSRF